MELLDFGVLPPVENVVAPPTGAVDEPPEACARVPPVFELPAVVWLALELELPPTPTTPPAASLTPPLLEPARAVMPPEAEIPPLPDDIDDAPAGPPPAEAAAPELEPEPPQATSRLHAKRENWERDAFIAFPQSFDSGVTRDGALIRQWNIETATNCVERRTTCGWVARHERPNAG